LRVPSPEFDRSESGQETSGSGGTEADSGSVEVHQTERMKTV
jgi:hypothetical protein